MVRVRVGRVVQNDRLGEIPPDDVEIFDVVTENAGAVVLIQTMSTREIVLKHILQFLQLQHASTLSALFIRHSS